MKAPGIKLFRQERKDLIDELYKDDVWEQMIFQQVVDLIDPDDYILDFMTFQIKNGKSIEEAKEICRQYLMDQNAIYNKRGQIIRGVQIRFNKANE